MSGLQRKTFRTSEGDIAYWVNRAQAPGIAGIPDALTAPWLVFLPGLTADHRLFDKQVAHFADRANVLVWDAPSHGESRPFVLTWTMDDLAQWLHGILACESIERPVLVGQSMGGYVAQAFMGLYPDAAAGFVSIDSCPLQRSYYRSWELAALRHTKLMFQLFPWKTLVDLGSDNNSMTEYGRGLMREMMLDYGKHEYCELSAHGFRVLADAVETARPFEISCPYALICGEEDRAGSAKRYNRAWEKRTGNPVHWLAGAGHNANCDNPEAVNTVIEEIVERL